MNTCIACGGDLKNEGKIEGYIQGNFYEVCACVRCQTKFSNPHKVDTVVYEYIYKHSADTPGYMRYHHYAEEVLAKRNPLRWLAAQEHVYYAVAKSLPKSGRVLEVGCGLGYFTYALAQTGYDVLGIDVSEEAITEARRRYGDHFSAQDFFSMNETQHGQYDAIIMVELIEHVEDPERYLSHAQTLLAPGGSLIVTTPNRSWYTDLPVLWSSDLPPVHLTWFSEDGLRLLAERLQYSVTMVPFTVFNIFHGSLVGPRPNTPVNPPFFTAEGKPLFGKFVHSKLYHMTRKIGLYGVLKNLMSWKSRLTELGSVLAGNRKLSVKRSSCMCVVLTRV